MNDIDHTKAKAKSPQTNGICERFHRTVGQEFYQIAFRKKLYTTIEELKTDLDAWIDTCARRTSSIASCLLLTGGRYWQDIAPGSDALKHPESRLRRGGFGERHGPDDRPDLPHSGRCP